MFRRSVTMLSKVASRLLSMFMSCLLAALVVITFVDVIGRKIGYPLSFAFEITELMMGVMIYLGLPLVSARVRDGHISIDLFTSLLGSKGRKATDIFSNLLCAALTVVLALYLWRQAGTLQSFNNVTMFLRWPLAPFIYFMSVMSALTVIVFFTRAIYVIGNSAADEEPEI